MSKTKLREEFHRKIDELREEYDKKIDDLLTDFKEIDISEPSSSHLKVENEYCDLSLKYLNSYHWRKSKRMVYFLHHWRIGNYC